MKVLKILVITLSLPGCGTMATLTSSDEEVAMKLRKYETRCESTSRLYGGVSYNICQLHAKPKKTTVDGALAYYLFDTAASAIADTVILPYTIHQQLTKGNLTVAPKK